MTPEPGLDLWTAIAIAIFVAVILIAWAVGKQRQADIDEQSPQMREFQAKWEGRARDANGAP